MQSSGLGNASSRNFEPDEAYSSGRSDSSAEGYQVGMPRNDEHGFAFMPLGRVKSDPDSAWNLKANPRTMPWHDTGCTL